MSAKPATEDVTKHCDIEREHHQWIEHEPDDAKVAASMPYFDGSDGELPPKFAFAGETAEEGRQFGNHVIGTVFR